MIQVIFYVAVLVFMFFSSTVSDRLGLDGRDTITTFLFTLPIFKALFIDRKKLNMQEMKPELFIMMTGIVLCLIKVFIGDAIVVKRILFFMVLPMLLSIVLSYQSAQSRKIIKLLILVFFVANCGLAIYERIIGVNIFPFEEENPIDVFLELPFRSTAFLGHPLMNALVISIIMGTVMISEEKLATKGFIFILGIVAILCFNARGATMIWTIISTISLVMIFKTREITKRTTVTIVFFITIAIGIFVYLIAEKGFGDRLLNNESKLYDSSAQARVDVFSAFQYVKAPDLIFGHSHYYLYITDKLGQAGVENSYVVLILFYGIPAFIFLMIGYYFWVSKYLANLTKMEKAIILLSFLLVGSLNNSLFDYTPWMFFILCMNSFLPDLEAQQLKKYILNY